jgi:hypothetical protein
MAWAVISPTHTGWWFRLDILQEISGWRMTVHIRNCHDLRLALREIPYLINDLHILDLRHNDYNQIHLDKNTP